MKTALPLLMLALLFTGLPAQAGELFEVGDKIPEFDLPYATRDTINMTGIKTEDLKGERYILAFYPADWSPGCTKELCAFRDAHTDLSGLGVEFLAVSGDYVFSHHAWAKHHNLNFKLLADHTRKYGKQMGVYLEEYGVMQRSVFVVGPDETFEYIDYDYSVADDTDFNALHDFLKTVD